MPIIQWSELQFNCIPAKYVQPDCIILGCSCRGAFRYQTSLHTNPNDNNYHMYVRMVIGTQLFELSCWKVKERISPMMTTWTTDAQTVCHQNRVDVNGISEIHESITQSSQYSCLVWFSWMYRVPREPMGWSLTKRIS